MTYFNSFRLAVCAALAGLSLIGATGAHADTLSVSFDRTYVNGTFADISSVATLDLSLNANGTIAATLTADQQIQGLAFNTGAHHTPLIFFSPSGPQPGGWGNAFGRYDSGFGYLDQAQAQAAPHTFTFTIGAVGQFNSVFETSNLQSFDGDPPVANRYFLFTYDGSTGHQYGGDPSTVAAVPEPESYAMLLAGLGVLGFAARRRKQKVVVRTLVLAPRK